ncbi:MAG: hypothetical protein CFE29_04545 [Bradyrhizobiaceae bacterium PARB1]|jgi:hypothetical protein|nr:MAG: hypothetical protein CFE29_04545 [Bradyrhizobiaceae bacterium PARB1]
MTEHYKTEALVNALMMTGAGPSAEAIAAAPELTDWRYEVNELTGVIVLTGRSEGHPSIPSTELMSTTRVRYVEPEFAFAITSNRIYRLGPRRPRG